MESIYYANKKYAQQTMPQQPQRVIKGEPLSPQQSPLDYREIIQQYPEVKEGIDLIHQQIQNLKQAKGSLIQQMVNLKLNPSQIPEIMNILENI